MTHQTSFSSIQPFIDSYHNTPEIHRPRAKRLPPPPLLVHPLAGSAGVLDGLMSICLSVPAVQVGGYSAQQVEIGRHTATPPASRGRASVASASPQPHKGEFDMITEKKPHFISHRHQRCVRMSSILWLRPCLFLCLQASLPTSFHWEYRHLSLQIWNSPNLDQMFTLRHPKYTPHSDASRACRHWLAI